MQRPASVDLQANEEAEDGNEKRERIVLLKYLKVFHRLTEDLSSQDTFSDNPITHRVTKNQSSLTEFLPSNSNDPQKSNR